MSRSPCKLFDECASLFCTQAERLINSTLPDKEESVLSKPCPIEQLIQIA
jgi:hypothetical protein